MKSAHVNCACARFVVTVSIQCRNESLSLDFAGRVLQAKRSIGAGRCDEEGSDGFCQSELRDANALLIVKPKAVVKAGHVEAPGLGGRSDRRARTRSRGASHNSA